MLCHCAQTNTLHQYLDYMFLDITHVALKLQYPLLPPESRCGDTRRKP
jgi:hypothetical protein